MRVLIAGGSGFIGTELARQLREDNHDVRILVRRQPANDSEINWAPSAGIIDSGIIEATDAVINLSGAPLARLPWTARYRSEILESRLTATRALTDAMARSKKKPKVFLSGSAVGIYGDRPGERLTEESARGAGFLGDVVEQWEQVAQLRPVATRVVVLRTGVVIGDGGSLAPIKALTRVGLGSRLATGGDIWPWISLHDEAAAIRHLLTSKLTGPVNLAGPTPATSDRITRHVAARMHRPYLLRAPQFALTAALQSAAPELLLSSQHVIVDRLIDDGFRFRDETVEQAIDAVISGR
jgi:uncharacterized protein (TIGR01777 family)